MKRDPLLEIRQQISIFAQMTRTTRLLPMKPKRNFCEISPFTYFISKEKEIQKRYVQDLFHKIRFAKTLQAEKLPFRVKTHKSLIRRRLGNVDMQLQENKAVNLKLASAHLQGVLIRPGETFSLWRLVGRTSARKGYKEGLTISKSQTGKGIGGGLCQLSNLIHWMVLHSDLTIVEQHHHDSVDLFPDFNRQVPFGTGTSISYNYLDYRFRNDTDCTFQLFVYVDDEYLCGELYSSAEPKYSYHIHAEGEYFAREEDGNIYRNGTVVRDTVDKKTGAVTDRETIRTNHAKVLYEMNLP